MGLAWNVKYYRRANGEVPAKEFIAGLPAKHQAKALYAVDMLGEFGADLHEPFAKPIQGQRYKGLWELRIRFANDISRIFYFVPVGDTFVLLHGFVKKTNAIPASELERAKRCMDECLARCEDDG